MVKKRSAVLRAIEALGGPVSTADVVGVRYQSVAKWKRSERVTGLLHAYRLSEASGIPLEDFAKDLEATASASSRRE
jgi:hypothetical protein